MSEKYFAYIIGVSVILAVLMPVAAWRWYMRLRYLQNLARINILKRQQKMGHNTFFATAVINRCVRILYCSFSSKAKDALLFLVGGRVEKAADFLTSSEYELALLLRAHITTSSVYRQIYRRKRHWFGVPEYCVYLPILAHLMYDYRTTITAVEKLSKYLSKPQNALIKAYYRYISGYVYLYEGDMLSASQTASAALKFFQKKQYAVETAACHLLLAEIYRISCVNDIAETMIDSAVKIYQTQNLPLFEAKAIVAKGMLMVFENRFEEAAAQYEKALVMTITEQLRADIYNQQALLYLAQNNLKAAHTKISKALTIQQALKNRHGTAFSLQLAAQIAFKQKQLHLTQKSANHAASLYIIQGNSSACAECMYLAAEAQYQLKMYQKAEKNLRQILDLNRKTALSFHVANAYSLLGLIYLQKNDLQRAKVLFQQALHLEQSKQRCEGMIADYTNLALIEELTDNPENAASNREIALEYAKQTEDEELIALIEKTKKF